MTDKELIYIKTIADEKNLTRAAQVLHIAQPSLTQLLHRIEERLGAVLFVRDKKGMTLTAAGQLYYALAKEVLDRRQAFLDKLAQLKLEENQKLNISASWYNTLLILDRIIPVFREKFPQVKLTMVEKNSAESLQLLAQGNMDLVFLHRYPREYPVQESVAGGKWKLETLFRERFVVVANKAMGLPAKEGELVKGALEGRLFVSFTEKQRIRHIIEFVFQQARIKPRETLSTYGFISAMELASHGTGFCILPEQYVRQNISKYPDLVVYGIPEEYPAYWEAAVCYEKEKERNKPVKAFLSLAKHVELDQ